MHFANRANNTLHLFKASFEEYKQWFMGKVACASPFHLPVWLARHQTSTVSMGRCGSKPEAWVLEGQEEEGATEKCQELAERLVSRLSHNTLEVAAGGFTCLDISDFLHL